MSWCCTLAAFAAAGKRCAGGPGTPTRGLERSWRLPSRAAVRCGRPLRRAAGWAAAGPAASCPLPRSAGLCRGVHPKSAEPGRPLRGIPLVLLPCQRQGAGGRTHRAAPSAPAPARTPGQTYPRPEQGGDAKSGE